MTIAAPAAPAAPAAAAPAPAGGAPAAQPAAQPAAAPAAAPSGEPAKPAAAEPQKTTILGSAQPKDGAQPEPQKKEGAPEKYDNFTLPEGLVVNEKLLDGFRTLAKDMGLSQASAQKFVDLQAQNVKAELDARLSEFNTQITDWEKQSRTAFGADADKQFGIASKAVERFGSPALRELLNESGLGNHPELVKFFARVGSAISEDQPVEGRSAGGEAVPTARLMYPTMEKKT